MSRALCLLPLALLLACQKVPPNRYGVQSIAIEGAEIFDPDSILKCLATQERDEVEIDFDLLDSPRCGIPPFEGDRAKWELWSWPWTEWPYYDRVMLEQDLVRIERWYAARGHHHARVTDTSVVPESATDTDILDPEEEEPGCIRRGDGEGCEVDIVITVEEGEPTLVDELNLYGLDEAPESLREAIEDAIQLTEGERWDEAFYDQSKTAIKALLAEEGYARAEVKGQVRIDRTQRKAIVDLQISPGPVCVFGVVRVAESGELPAETIGAAALIYRGERYSQSAIVDAQRAIYGLGAFSAVVVEPVIPDDGNVIDVEVTVSAARKHRFGLGGGITSGIIQRNDFSQISVARWDVHLVARYENRNFLGGLRRLTTSIEPKLIFPQEFPGFSGPRPGISTHVGFRQPAFLEPRTNLRIDFRYDLGLDQRDVFFRHQIDTGLYLERYFWQQRIFISLGLPAFTWYKVPSGEVEARQDSQLTEPELPDLPASYFLLRLEQVLWLDLRDDATRPHKGFYFQLNLQEAGYIWGNKASSWDYIRIQPDARVYIPLPRRITIAARFLVGAFFDLSVNDENIDDLSRELGPRTERFYGGGAAGNRGYLANRLGAGREGGIRRWLAQVELRTPLTANFGMVFFADAGDVSRTDLNFQNLQLSVGFGFRYYTIIGPIRLDLGFRVPSAETLGQSERVGRVAADDTNVSLFSLVEWPGALHISIGEAF